jgi:hypothetical protein
LAERIKMSDCAPSQPSELANSVAGRSSTPSPGSAIYRDMWAVVFPDGHIVTGSDLNTEDDAWRIALGWPGPEEIEDAIKRGAFAVKARLRYYSPNDKVQELSGGK